VQGIGYGFMERFRNGQRAIEHPGDTLGTSSLLTLVPDQNWGFFVSYNSPAGSESANELANALLDRYAPGQVGRPVPAGAPVARYAGNYRVNRYPHNDWGKLQGLMLSVSVTDNGDGSVTMTYPLNLRPAERLIPVEPLLFRSEDGQHAVAFAADSRGRITRMYMPMAVFAAERLAWYESPLLHLGLLGAVALLSLCTVVGWPIGALVRRRRDRPALPVQVRTARWLGGVVSGLTLIFLTGLGVFMASALQTAVYGTPAWVKPLMLAPLLASVLTVPLVWATVRACRVAGWSVWGKLHLGLMVIAFVPFVGFLWYWNLLGLNA
ncbi:MAG TPA: hypothetical protein VNT75_16210, partial [Symbiobacteriaceae bacterium]|nr:hypothetical protein [Symbiobacteriaceae bacterium]